MADGSRDVTIKIRLQAEGQADIRKGIEEAVSKPAKIAQGDVNKLRASTAEAMQNMADLSRVGDAALIKMQNNEKRYEAARRDSRIKELKSKKRSSEEEIEMMRLGSEKQAAIEAAQARFRKIRTSERLAAYKREKAEEVRIAQEAEAKKRAAERGPGFFSEQKGGFARGVAGAMAAPAAVGLGTQFANSIGDTLKTIAAIVRGDEEGAKRSPLYMAGVNFWEGVKEFSESTGLFRDILPKILPDFLQDEKKRRAETLKEDEAKALTLQAQLNDIILKRTQAERDLLAAEKQRIEAARQEFGLMTQPEQQAIANIAKKIGAGGIQALTGPELEQARGFQGFAGLITEQAKQAAGAGGFDAILAATGAAKRAADLEAKIKAEVKNTFNLDLDPADLANQLEEKIKPALAKVEAEMIKTLQSELKATETRIRQAQAIPLQ
jgi:hypothetical protein